MEAPTHQRFGTTLVETTWHEIVDPAASRLSPTNSKPRTHPRLEPRSPDPGAAPVKHERLARLIRNFMSHVKASSLYQNDYARLRDQPKGQRRSRLFLELYWQIFDRWEADLRRQRRRLRRHALQAAELLEARPDAARLRPGDGGRVPGHQQIPGATDRASAATRPTCSPLATTGRPSTASPARTCRR